MTSATVGERYQIVIPRKERKKVYLKPHSKVQVEARNGYLIIHPVTGKGLRGIGRDISDNNDAADYISKLRSEWKKRP